MVNLRRQLVAVAGAVALVVLPAPTLLAGELRVASVFTSNAVLQQGVSAPVWGWAEPGSTVTVRFAGQVKTTQAAGDGAWKVELSPLKANAAGRSMLVESAGQRHELRNVLVGEVWYASGQSNMQMSLASCAAKLPAIAAIAAAPPATGIRILRVGAAASDTPLTQLKGAATWQLDSPQSRGRQSAVAYLFARQLHNKLGAPVGVIEGSWGGKPVEGFIPQAQFKKHKALQPILTLARQNKLEELARLKGGVVVRNAAGMPGRIYNARIAPVAPYALRGFIWYQGESNAGHGEDPRNYRIKMQALVAGVRAAWSQPMLPFYFVQLPAYNNQATGWVRLREEQRLSLAIPHTGMAVTIDLQDNDIHPANKLDVSDRLARWALARTYAKKLPYSGPLFKSAEVTGDTVRVEFEHASNGLMIAAKHGLAPPRKDPTAALLHFEVAGADGVWRPAQATVKGSAVLVRSAAAPAPRAVRYACSGGPAGANLYNVEGLPASPFCSQLDLLPWKPPQ